MEKIKTTCLYCGLETEMEIVDKYFIDGRPGRLFEIECPRCHRLFGRHIEDEPKGGLQNGGQREGAGKA